MGSELCGSMRRSMGTVRASKRGALAGHEHVLGVACAVVGVADHLVAHAYARHARADLLDHAGEVRALAAGKGQGEDLAD